MMFEREKRSYLEKIEKNDEDEDDDEEEDGAGKV